MIRRNIFVACLCLLAILAGPVVWAGSVALPIDGVADDTSRELLQNTSLEQDVVDGYRWETKDNQTYLILALKGEKSLSFKAINQILSQANAQAKKQKIDAEYDLDLDRFFLGEQLELVLKPMICESCVNHVKTALKDLPGIASSEVNLGPKPRLGTLRITFGENRTLPFGLLKRTLNKYELIDSTFVAAPALNKTNSCCKGLSDSDCCKGGKKTKASACDDGGSCDTKKAKASDCSGGSCDKKKVSDCSGESCDKKKAKASDCSGGSCDKKKVSDCSGESCDKKKAKASDCSGGSCDKKKVSDCSGESCDKKKAKASDCSGGSCDTKKVSGCSGKKKASGCSGKKKSCPGKKTVDF